MQTPAKPLAARYQAFREGLRRWAIKTFHWEYWPMQVAYAPVFVYWFFLGLRLRHWGFFLAANPAIEYAGMRGESKSRIMAMLPERWKPRTLLVAAGTPLAEALAQIEAAGLTFPLFAKPDIGERGMQARKLPDAAALAAYLAGSRVAFQIQPFVDEPEEYAVLHWRHPDGRSGISSLTIKGFLSVLGDGRSSVAQLMARDARAALQLPRYRREQPELLRQVLPAGERRRIGEVGNHCLGTMFIDGRAHISPAMVATFDAISQSMPGVCFARYDLKCRSLADLAAGRHIQILEINGVGAEPAHIYDPGLGLRERYGSLFAHWRLIFDISRANHALGAPYMDWPTYRAWRRHMRAYYAQVG